MAFGYNKKILKVNLTDLSFEIEEKDEYFYRTFMGGSAMASYFLLTETEKGVDALGPDNALVVTTSVLTGSKIQGANRSTIASKSPLNDGFGEAEAGGFFANELKRSGFDAIVIKGKASKPTYLYLKDGAVEFKDATHLWGKDVGVAGDTIVEEIGEPRAQVISIGQGGENMVRYACVINLPQASYGRSGMGAVFGSKNLKAIVARGTQELEFADNEKIKELRTWFNKNRKDHPICQILSDQGTLGWDLEDLDQDGVLPTKNWQMGSFDKASKVSFDALKATVYSGMSTCYACPVACRPKSKGGKYNIDEKFGGVQYETAGSFGPNLLVDDIEVIAKAHELCQKYSIDTIDTGVTIGFAMECYEHGLLTKDDLDGIELTWGNGEGALKLVEKIALREGCGDFFAEGAYRMAEKIGKGSEKFVIAVKKQAFAMHEPRGKNNIGFSCSTSPTGGDHIEAPHDMSFTDGGWASPDLYSIGILKGVPAKSMAPTKVAWFVKGQMTYNLLNSLGMCFFTAGPARLFRMNQIVEMVAAATGWETSLYEIMMLGERTATLARQFLTREGQDRRDDMLPDRMFEKLKNGVLEGVALDKKDFEKALDLYYEMMGWDNNGIPRDARLHFINTYDLEQF
jgi:aldehyde:ferredoxin oxidoreductase